MVNADHQRKHNDCGISAIKTIFNLFKIDIPRAYIELKLPLDHEGTWLSDIYAFFTDHQIKANYHILDLNQKAQTYYEGLTPFILPLERKEGLHFVVVSRIKRGQATILDPAAKTPYKLSLGDIRKTAYHSKSKLDYVHHEERMTHLCREILREYQLNIAEIEQQHTLDQLFNKITYFIYIRDHYELKDRLAEIRTLKDLLFNQTISQLPGNFRTFTTQNDALTIKAPVILTVTQPESKHIDTIAQPMYPPQTGTDNIYRRLFQQLGVLKQSWYFYLFLVVMAASITQLSVFINQFLIDNVLIKKNLSLIFIFTLGLALYKLFELGISLLKSWVSIKIGRALDYHFLTTFDTRINRYSLMYIDSFQKGDLTERLSDATRLKSFFLRFFIYIFVDCFVAFYTLGILLYMDWQLTLVILVVILLFYAWFRIITPHLQHNEQIRFLKKANFFSRMLEKLSGIQVLKSSRQEAAFSRKIFQAINELLDIRVKTEKINLMNTLVIALITLCATIIITLFLTYRSVSTNSITTGQVITFMALSQRIFSTLGKILNENITLQENQIILNRFFEFQETGEVTSSGTIKTFSINKMHLENVGFCYHSGKAVLKNICFTIHKGDKIRLEGKNGSGKSTLSKIITYLYTPTSGKRFINDQEDILYDQATLAKKTLLVSNEDLLFNDTFRFNVTFGEKISSKTIKTLAHQLNMEDLFQHKELGLDFVISENGRNLSTGQRKKILLLRALLHPAELIILDEVLSGIDHTSRKKIETFLNEITDKTFLIISHEPIEGLNFTSHYSLNSHD